MNKAANFLITGGFPFDMDTLDFMQSSYTALQEMARAIAGDKPCIVVGCEVDGISTTAGWVIIAGELLYFNGGTTGDFVTITESVISLTYRDGDDHTIFTTRTVDFTVTEDLAWSKFERIESLLQMNRAARAIGYALSNEATAIVLQGATVTKTDTGPDKYTNTAGAIFYQGKVYLVDERGTGDKLTSAGTPKWAIDTDTSKIKLVASTDTGLFAYNLIARYRHEIGAIGYALGAESSVILFGATVTKTDTGPDKYTNTAGAIFYQGKIYIVDERDTSNKLTSVGTPKWALDDADNSKIKLVASTDTGLFAYNTISRFGDTDLLTDEWIESTTPSSGLVTTFACNTGVVSYTGGTYQYRYRRTKNTVELHFHFMCTLVSGSSSVTKIYIPLPDGLTKKVQANNNFIHYGFAQYDLPGAGSPAGPMMVTSRDDGTEGNKITIRRIVDNYGGQLIFDYNGDLNVRGSITFELQ